jgi:hypothetical protein
MGVPEPAHLVGVVKTCPRPACRSTDVKWRYYNNAKASQPRYQCLECDKCFTYGGKVRLSHEEKRRAASKEALRAAKKKAAKKLIDNKKSAKLEAAKEVEPRRRRFGSVVRCVVAPPIAEVKRTPRIRLRLIGGAVIHLHCTSEVQQVEDGGAEASDPGGVLQGEAGSDCGSVASSESRVGDHLGDSGGSESELDSEELVNLGGLASMRSWECLFL